MRLGVIYPRLPPRVDGVGDHTLLLSSELGHRGHEVTIFHTEGSLEGTNRVSRAPLELKKGPRRRRMMEDLRSMDWVLIQYSPFAYSRYGINPLLVRLVLELARSRSARLGLLLHETYIAPEGSMRQRILSNGQWLQMNLVVSRCHAVAASTEKWISHVSSRAPSKSVMPMASNLPEPRITKGAARRAVNIRDEQLVAVTFGTMAPAHRDRDALADSLRTLQRHAAVALYVGPNGAEFESLAVATGVDYRLASRLNTQQAADILAAADIGLAPFVGGVSPRRGSFLALLQMSLPVITTFGPMTGSALTNAAALGAFRLTSPENFAVETDGMLTDSTLRARTGKAGREYLLANHTWSHVVDHLEQQFAAAHTSDPAIERKAVGG